MPRKRVSVEMKEVRVRIPKQQYDKITELVKEGEYIDASEVVRDAIRKLLKEVDE